MTFFLLADPATVPLLLIEEPGKLRIVGSGLQDVFVKAVILRGEERPVICASLLKIDILFLVLFLRFPDLGRSWRGYRIRAGPAYRQQCIGGERKTPCRRMACFSRFSGVFRMIKREKGRSFGKKQGDIQCQANLYMDGCQNQSE